MAGARRSIISEATLIPAGLVITLLGLAFWVGTVSSTATNNTRDLAVLRDDSQHGIEYVRDQRQKFDEILSNRMREQDKVMADVQQRVAKMEGKIDLIYDAVVRKK